MSPLGRKDAPHVKSTSLIIASIDMRPSDLMSAFKPWACIDPATTTVGVWGGAVAPVLHIHSLQLDPPQVQLVARCEREVSARGPRDERRRRPVIASVPSTSIWPPRVQSTVRLRHRSQASRAAGCRHCCWWRRRGARRASARASAASAGVA